MKNRKQYFAFVAEDMCDYFESKLAEHSDNIYYVKRGLWEVTDEGTIFRRYVIIADEGVIDPKYEVPYIEGDI